MSARSDMGLAVAIWASGCVVGASVAMIVLFYRLPECWQRLWGLS